jgi:hypothetical protein
MATTADDVWRLLGELTEAQKETERQLQETKQILQEETTATRQLLRQQNEQFNQQMGQLGNRLGDFVEWQVRLFQERVLLSTSFTRGPRRGATIKPSKPTPGLPPSTGNAQQCLAHGNVGAVSAFAKRLARRKPNPQ